MIYVVDASVALKWFTQEEGTEQALTFKEHFLAGKITLTSPDLMLYEVAHVLRYKKQLTEAAINEALHYLLQKFEISPFFCYTIREM